MIRGEPYILFFMSLFLFIILKNEQTTFKPHIKTVLFTGVVIACIALSRQWGILLFPPLVILLFFTRLEVISPEGYKSSFSASLTVFLIKFSLSFIRDTKSYLPIATIFSTDNLALSIVS